MIGGQRIPFRETLLVALAAGLGYGFDAYAVNIFGILGPLLAKDLDITVKTIGLVGVDYRAALWLEWTFIFAIVPALLVSGLRWIIHSSRPPPRSNNACGNSALLRGRRVLRPTAIPGDQICWIADKSQSPPRRRTNVHNSSASAGVRGSPLTM
jgi:hypothetical protein